MSKDKILHLSLAAVLVIAGMLGCRFLHHPDLALAVPAIVFAIGIGKEVFDYIRKKDTVPAPDLKDQCLRDFFADCLGIVAGVFLAALAVLMIQG